MSHVLHSIAGRPLRIPAMRMSIFSSKDEPEKGKGSPAGDNSFRFWF
jgi:hypothetical protein